MPSDVENLILIKRSSISGVVPQLSSLKLGELGLNTADGKIFLKTETPELTSVKEFLNSDDQYFVFNKELSAVNTKFGGNTVTQVFASVLGGYNIDIYGAGSTVINGEDNDIEGDFATIGNGVNNKITVDGDYSFNASGQNNLIQHQNVFTLGSNLTSHSSDFTYVNNISANGKIYGDGSELTGIVTTNSNVESLSANWENTYTTVQSNSAFWGSNGEEGTINRILKQENFESLKNNYYIVDTSIDPITATLPSSPNIGDSIFFKDAFLTWKTNNFTLSNNTNMIQGLNENIICDVNGLGFYLTYIGSNVGWRIE
jgi:hypothetical protein